MVGDHHRTRENFDDLEKLAAIDVTIAVQAVARPAAVHNIWRVNEGYCAPIFYEIFQDM
jgi:hypothetical protein